MEPQELWDRIVQLETERAAIGLEFFRSTPRNVLVSLLKNSLRGGFPMTTALRWLEGSSIEIVSDCFFELADVSVTSHSQGGRARELAKKAYAFLGMDRADAELSRVWKATQPDDALQFAFLAIDLGSKVIDEVESTVCEREDEVSKEVCEEICNWRQRQK